MKRLLFIIITAIYFSSPSQLFSQEYFNINGHVRDLQTGEALAGVNVFFLNTNYGAATDEKGYYLIQNVPADDYILRAQMIGYATAERKIKFNSIKVIEVNFYLESASLKMETIVVTGTKTPRYLKDAPVRTEVVTSHEIERRNPVNFMEAVSSINGVEQQIECSICNASNISLQGMPGRYTQVLINGMPQFSSLGQMYTYMQLPANFIEQIEIIKGSKSSLYGTDAIAGIVNIRTKRPTYSPRLNLTGLVGGNNERRFNGVGSYRQNELGILLAGEYYGIDAYDGNNDGITEFTNNNRGFFNGKIDYEFNKSTSLDFTFSAINDKRQGGAVAMSRSFIETIDSAELRNFSESILTQRIDVSTMITRKFGDKTTLYLKSAYANHFQDSDYEGFIYVADQDMTYNELQADFILSDIHQILAGTAYRTEDLNENAAISEYHYRIFSLFAQYSFMPSPIFEGVFGARLDNHNIFNNVATTSINLRFQPIENWNLRLNFGQGFRAPTTFYELDHGSGSRYKYNIQYLAKEAEKSNSYSFSIDYAQRSHILSFSAFYHRIHNFITAFNDSESQSFIVENVKSPSSIYGIEASWSKSFFKSVSVSAGYIYKKYKISPELLGFARPNHKFKWSFDIDLDAAGLDLKFDGSIFGKMNLQEVYGEAYNKDLTPKMNQSPAYAVFNAEASKSLSELLKLSLGVKNIFNYRQIDKESPLMYDENGEFGDVVYIWGPMYGRKIYAQLSLSLN